MRVRMVCLEDGIYCCGFRKMAAYVERLNPDTRTCYVSTNRWATVWRALMGQVGAGGDLDADGVDEIAQALADADVVGYSSMTGYAPLTRAIAKRLREINPGTYQVWGGIHPIIHPEDAILADVDAICTGEGEFAFEQLLGHLEAGTDPSETKNFWFPSAGQTRGGRDEVRNGFLPLLTNEELEQLPFPKYGGDEWIYKQGQGLVPMTTGDYLATNGLAYTAIWSIGCPFHCSFCGNTKFIANDRNYRRIRHPSPRYVIEEVKAARRAFPHISSVSFHDDSFMAIPLRQIEEFAELWRSELAMPFTVFGVIPNYVQREKFEVLTWAGMNRVRMGIQSGSRRILDFYKRPTPIEKIEAATEVCASFSPRYHIPPTYDIIVDNPIETREDVVDTLELLYRMDRPYSLNVYSLKVIPNTELERAIRELGVDIEEISSSYNSIPPRWANLLVYLLPVWRPPRWLFDRMLSRVRPSIEEQPMYPLLAIVLRFLYLSKRSLAHLRFMDFSNLPGRSGWFAWKLGLVRFWQRHLVPAHPRRDRRPQPEPASDAAA